MPSSTTSRRRSIAVGTVLGVLLSVAAAGATPTHATTRAKDQADTLKLGYYDNVTHAPALVELENGSLEQALGPKVKLDTSIFNAGPAEVTALLSGSIDVAYIGPNPTVTAFLQSHGAVQVVSGVASGGAFLVVKPGINSAKQLKGKVLATPQLGNTQDVALRRWLKKHGLSTDATGGGDVSIRPQDNAITLTAFQQGDIQGAWVPEPWATRLVKEGGGKILVDERTLWPRGKYVTTDVLVRKDYLQANPGIITKLLAANLDAIVLINKKPAQAEALVGTRIKRDSGKSLPLDLIAASFKNIVFTVDPVSSSLVASAKSAALLGLPGSHVLTKSDVKRLYDLTLLNKLLTAKGRPAVTANA
jgi:NitT/TauT family transport system substrate-binding protein